MSFNFSKGRDQYIDNLINSKVISLYDDHTDSNLHFSYKDKEVISKLNNPHHHSLLNVITDVPHNNDTETIKEDYFRVIYIYIDIKSIIEQDDEGDFEDDEDFDLEDEEEETFNDRLKRHFKALYLTKKQEEAYNSADNKVSLLGEFLMSDEGNIFSFSSITGLKIFDDHVEFMAPYLSRSTNSWIAYSCSIIDKLLNYNNVDEDEDDIDWDDDIE